MAKQMVLKKLIMIPWDKVCSPKQQGGLGVINIHNMNNALLARWLWYCTSSKDNLWSRLVATLQNELISFVPEFSPLKNAFQTIAPLLNAAVLATPGDGTTVLFTPDANLTLAQFLLKWLSSDRIFNDLVKTSQSATAQWSLLTQLLSAVNLASLGCKDSFCWRLKLDGKFSVKSIYKLQKAHPKVNSTLFCLWKLNIPPRMRLFIWQMAQNKIATIDNLKKRGWHLANICSLCVSNEETVHHLFNDCVSL
ncbi:hypothetical protein LUZ63_013126 [Rhynchospora breviuscula]|uniref:Reverse transcriptase zinc-binding domain-containing protein n=1 Tax=Rhynchospora breviuscula TaxID=2022672 RepID=A0A9Q0C7Y4_9POAL|nr:hypothetical protein LUZ63_013126 [Rhynchospora breviuscula]